MADLKTTLVLLYFIRSPTQVGEHESKASIEKRSAWTFQGTSQIEMPDGRACQIIGDIMMKEIEPVSTMTVRGYCLCEKGDGKLCELPPTVAGATEPASSPTVQRLGPREPKIPLPKQDNSRRR